MDLLCLGQGKLRVVRFGWSFVNFEIVQISTVCFKLDFDSLSYWLWFEWFGSLYLLRKAEFHMFSLLSLLQ